MNYLNIRKKFVAFLFFILISIISYSQNEWTWINGTPLVNQKGYYGTKNIPSPNNTPGGRFNALSWTDLTGDLWLYGGNGEDSITMSGGLSDLWKFDVALKQWIWISGSPFSAQTTNTDGKSVYGTIGVPSASNTPGYRTGSATWTDNAGNLWLFGGFAGDTMGSSGGGIKNDLWKYNIATNMWTWMKGSKGIAATAVYGTQGVMTSSNVPGARNYGMVSWTDFTGNFWMFGGQGITATNSNGYLNDLWKYDVASNQWVWMKGSSSTNQSGIWGTIGVSNSTNHPSSREESFNWMDKNGDLWVFGGAGYDVSSNAGSLNDLWRYSITSNQWTWMKGTNIKNQVPIYGAMNVPIATSRPGSMGNGGCWIDSTGNLWLSNAVSSNAVATGFYTNIMWKYNVSTNIWTWTKGPNVLADQVGIFGTKNVSAITNIPGGRAWPNSWSRNGEFWLFGGFGHGNSILVSGQLNDLWRFIPCYTNTTLVTNTTPASNYTLCNGSTTNLNASSSGTVTWYDIYNSPIGSGTLYTTPTLTTNQTNPFLSTPHTFLFGDNVSCLLTSITLSVFPNPTINITATSSVICAGSSTTLNALSGAFSYTWNTGANTTTISVSPSVTSTYTVSASNFSTGCTSTAVKTITVNTCTGLNEQFLSGNNILIYPNPNNGAFKLQLDPEIENGELILFNMIGQKVYSQKIKQGENEIKTQGLAKGLYHYSILQNKMQIQEGKIIIE